MFVRAITDEEEQLCSAFVIFLMKLIVLDYCKVGHALLQSRKAWFSYQVDECF